MDTDGACRVVDYLKARLVTVPVTDIGDLITSGFVRVGDGGAAARTFDRVAGGDLLRIDRSALELLQGAGRWNPPWNRALPIVHEDDDLLVIDKPAGVHVHPLGDRREGTVVNALVYSSGARRGQDGDLLGQPWGRWRAHVVSRLDCVVSGLLLVAKSAVIKTAFVREQKRGGLHRRYRAMVIGRVEGDAGTIDAAIGREPGRGYRRAVVEGGVDAVTHWRVLERFSDRSLLELVPATGRTHQLRVHLASIGHPIVGDQLYADDTVPLRLEDGSAVPIALHADALRFVHPRRGGLLLLRSESPRGFGEDPAPAP